MKLLEEQGMWEILLQTWENVCELLKQAYGEECMSHTQYYKWFKSFKERRSVEHQSVKTPGLDDVPHQHTTAMSREFVR